MPIKRIRVGVYLDDDVDPVITGLSKLLHIPKSKVINQLLLDSLPSLTLALDALKKREKGNKSSVLDAMRFMLEDAGFCFDEAKKKAASR